MKESRNKKPPELSTRKPRDPKKPGKKTAGQAEKLAEGGFDLDLLRAVTAWEQAKSGGEGAYEAAIRGIEPQARARVRQGYERLFRHRARLGWLAERHGLPPGMRVIWALGAVVLDRADPDKTAPLTVTMTGEIRSAARALARARADGLEHPEMPPAVRLECPPAFEASLRAAFGPAFEGEMRALALPPPLDLRANLLKGTRDAALKALNEGGYTAQHTPYSPWGLRLKGRRDIGASPLLEGGNVEAQDEGSQIAALLVDARPGMQVLDFCAGAGGKTLALAAAMGNRGHLVAADVSAARLARAKIRLKRAGAENASRKLLTGDDADPWLKSKAGLFDRVLVDAPCTGTGAWRRNPDAKWRADAKLEPLTAQQSAILSRAARMVKPGGRLVYVTCSVLTEENERIVASFLKENSLFKTVSVKSVWESLSPGPWPFRSKDVLKLTPAEHGTDGFFACVMERAKG
jgi:16S rRNA (cytosine967-C5)-methyltransferase